MAILTAERPARAPAKRLSAWTMTREAIAVGFDAGDGFLGRARGTDVLIRCTYAAVHLPPPLRDMQRIILTLDRSVNTLIDERLAHPTDSADLLNVLLRADQGTWPRRRVRDEALTFMLAGHETTANAMSWFWYLMAPHGGGRRICIGQSFAMVEMVLMAAIMSQHFTFDLAPGHAVELEATLTLRPKHGLHVVASRRS